jgi:multidrug efflux system outer membrane protein
MREGRQRLIHIVPRTTAALLLCVGSGCAHRADQPKPSVEIPPAYRFAAEPIPPAADPRGWWSAYDDPVLDKLVGEALASNRDLKVATARVEEFAAILAGTRAQGFPQIGYATSATRTRPSQENAIPSSGDPFNSLVAMLSASWDIDLWGRIRRESDAARANLLATKEAREGVILTLIASVITGYVTLLDLDEQLRIAKDTVASRKKTTDLFAVRLKGGWISDLEMAQAQAEYESTRAQIPPIEQAIAIQEHALSVLLGRSPGAIERDRTLAALKVPTVPAGLPSELLIRRPDIREAEQQLAASNALIEAARAEFFPRITLTALFGFASASLGSLFSGPAHTWSFTGDVAGPIYTGGGLDAALDQAVARRNQSLFSYEQAVQNAFRDVDDSLSSIRTSRESRETLERSVAALHRSVDVATDRYENGYSDYLTVLDAERSLFSAELQLTSARGDYQRSLTSLYRALGGDWTGAELRADAGPMPAAVGRAK